MNEIESWATASDSERVDMIKSVWEQGDSMRSIGLKLSSRIGIEVTRNAVAGVFSRNKAALVDCRLKTTPARIKMGLVEESETKVAPASPPEPKSVVPEPVVPKPVALKPVFFEPAVDSEPESFLLDLVDLTGTTCRWPNGDRNFKFCGAHVGSNHQPYCEYHTKLAFVPPRERQGKSFIPRRKSIGTS